MSLSDKRLKSISKWVEDQTAIRAVILIGSQARRGQTDRLSDLDLEIFVTQQDIFSEDSTWHEAFGAVWLKLDQNQPEGFSRKVIYEEGAMVEFSFYPLTALSRMKATLPEPYHRGYKILIDKDKAARELPKPSGHVPPKPHPTPDDVQSLINYFWYHAYHVAKYLWRQDLWRSKHYDWQLKQDLLRMMGWHASLCQKVEEVTTYEGKNLQTWVAPETYTALMTIFGRFYPADSWRAMEDTIRLFTQMAQDVASTLDMPYPKKTEKEISHFIHDLKTNPM